METSLNVTDYPDLPEDDEILYHLKFTIVGTAEYEVYAKDEKEACKIVEENYKDYDSLDFELEELEEVK